MHSSRLLNHDRSGLVRPVALSYNLHVQDIYNAVAVHVGELIVGQGARLIHQHLILRIDCTVVVKITPEYFQVLAVARS